MRLSDDGSAWGDWQAFSAATTHSLPGNAGDKTVYAQVRDAVGNVSSSFFATIRLVTQGTHTISASVTGTGGTISPLGDVTVSDGDDQTFTIAPQTGYHIADLVVDNVSVGKVSSYSFNNVVGNHTIAASFARLTYSLAYTAGEHGAISGEAAQTVAWGDDGTAVTAEPEAGYRFVAWSDGSTANPRTDTGVQADLAVSASFARLTYSLAYTAGEHGAISGEAAQTVAWGDDGTAVTAEPEAGYRFVAWSDGSTANPRTDTGVQADLAVSASFARLTYSLAYTAGEHGAISGEAAQTVAWGDDGTAVTAEPEAGYRFVAWSDGSTANPRTDTGVQADLAVSASFARLTYSLAYTAGEHGAISGEAAQTVAWGDDGTAVTAEPEAGYRFVAWSDGSTANPRTDTGVQADLAVSASFARLTYSLAYTAGEHGAISGEAAQTVAWGDDGTAVTAEPEAGYRFVAWSDGSTANPRTDTGVQADLAVSASFARLTYSLAYTAGEHGAISGEAAQTVAWGDDGTAVTAEPEAGYRFVAWSDGSTANPRTDTGVQADLAVSASFARLTYSLAYTAGEHGAISGEAAQTVAWGDDGTAVTAEPEAGYRFVAWSDGSTANPRTDTGVQADLAVSASFARLTFSLAYTAGEHGAISGDGRADRRLGRRRHRRDRRARGRLPLRSVVGRQHRQPAHRHRRAGGPGGERQLRAPHLQPRLHRRRARRDQRRGRADRRLGRRRHRRDRRARGRLPLRSVVGRQHRQPAHRHRRAGGPGGERQLRAQPSR